MGGPPYSTPTYVAGAKAALKHKGFTDSEICDTLLSMGIPEHNIRHIRVRVDEAEGKTKRASKQTHNVPPEGHNDA